MTGFGDGGGSVATELESSF